MFRSDYGGYVGTLPTGFFDVVYHVPAPVMDPDGGAVTYDTTKIRRIVFQIGSTAPVDGSADPTTVWIDSIVISGAPPPMGGGSYAPFTFDTSILPFSDNGGSPPATITWIP